jgi:hypothetical protein
MKGSEVMAILKDDLAREKY